MTGIDAEDWIDRVSGGLSPEALTGRLYTGRILFFDGLAPVASLVAETRAILEDVFDGAHPPTAYRALGLSGFRKTMRKAQRRFAQSPEIARYWTDALTAAGVAPEATYRDRLVLRSAPPHETANAPGYGLLPAHRDSWGSGLDCQINWWLPIYDLAPERTMAVFPRAWDRKVVNDSAGWDARRARSEPGYPELPTAREPLDWQEALSLVVPTGTLMAFSATHLHATVPNTTAEARISSETRTVDRDDLLAGRGAPNVDRGPVAPGTAWFQRLHGGASLQDDLEAVPAPR
ncbi:hypothetical protein [Dichotomicrobium thermohalophilum]|uniref:Phytanoyl-CoA dioxygenase PhyH n=1 Tax=Dichotomicrobium thermohalophilum TaxID=933063 RepID=A0A397PNI2_9HYPH|nr:hypothetical protein [Dichotomicrobium thermohalophilum]RIA47301.1 hypothetical protein BXY53_2684 [Dichotomicrobium thermohalophilum]